MILNEYTLASLNFVSIITPVLRDHKVKVVSAL